jgi:hypothetical protein
MWMGRNCGWFFLRDLPINDNFNFMGYRLPPIGAKRWPRTSTNFPSLIAFLRRSKLCGILCAISSLYFEKIQLPGRWPRFAYCQDERHQPEVVQGAPLIKSLHTHMFRNHRNGSDRRIMLNHVSHGSSMHSHGN